MLDMYDDDDDSDDDNVRETKSPKGKETATTVNVTALHGGIGIMNSNSPGTPGYYGNKEWEMQPTQQQYHVPTSPRAVHMSGAGGGGGGGGGYDQPLFTPRTQAFHTLDRRLPLRSG